MKPRFVVVPLIVIGLTLPARAQEFYSATEPRLFSPGDADSMYYNLPGSRPRIFFDDVSVHFSSPTSLFRVTKVTVQISRAADAPAVRVHPYYGQIVPDNLINGGPDDFPDFPDVALVSPFSTPVYLPATGTGSFAETIVSFGNGVTPLFTVPGSTAGNVPGLHSFAIGLDLSLAADANGDTRVDVLDLVSLTSHWMQSGTPQQGDFNLDGVVNSTDLGILSKSWQVGIGTLANDYARNGWTIARKDGNLDLLWDHVGPMSFGEFTYNVDSSGSLIIGTQYLRVEGEVVSGLGGDANADGKVDVRDLLAVADNWQQSATYAEGDFNFDGIVNATDLGVLALNWQSGVSFSEALHTMGLDASVIPEPSTLALCLLAVPLASRRRRKVVAWS